MKVETQFLEDHQVQIVAEFEPEMLDAARQRAARQLAKRVKIPGFRPGKAPYSVIERTVGESTIKESAVELLVNENYPKILEEAGVEPYASGSLEEISDLDSPTFRFTVPLRPAVTLGDYRSLRHPYEPPTVSDEDVDRVIRNLQDRQAIIEPVERAVQAGDQATVKLSGERLQVEEGQDAVVIAERSQTIDVAQEGDNTTYEWPFAGVSSHLIGMAVGESKTVTYTFPEEHDYESLRNQTVEFHFSVEDVKARTLPELNDDFAQTFGEFATLDDLKARVRENIAQQTQQEYDRAYTDAVLTELTAQSTIKYPPLMIEKEISAVIDEIVVNIERRGMTLETYLKAREMDEDALRAEVRPTAETRIQRALLVSELSRQEDIQLDQAAVQMQAYQTMNQITRNLSGKDLRKAQSQEFISNLVSNVTADMYTQATLERLMALAKGEVQRAETATADVETVDPVETQPAGEPEPDDSAAE